MKKIITYLLILNSFLMAEASLNETNKLFLQKDNKNIIDSKKQYELDKERLKFLKEKTKKTQSQYQENFQKIKDCELNSRNETEKKKCLGLKEDIKEKNLIVNTFNPEEILNQTEKELMLKKINIKLDNPNLNDLEKTKNQKLTNEELGQIKNFSKDLKK